MNQLDKVANEAHDEETDGDCSRDADELCASKALLKTSARIDSSVRTLLIRLCASCDEAVDAKAVRHERREVRQSKFELRGKTYRCPSTANSLGMARRSCS